MHNGLVAGNRTFRTSLAGAGGADNGSAAGVHVGAAEAFLSTFVMYNGSIANNTAYATRGEHATNPGGIYRAGGAGVFVHQFCTFVMNGGFIENNTLSGNRLAGSTSDFVLNGAGVLLLGRAGIGTPLANAKQFTMHGGTIRNNTVSMAAAGVDGVLGGRRRNGTRRLCPYRPSSS